MCRTATIRLVLAATAVAAVAQSIALAQDVPLDWRRIGNAAIRTRAGELATGPVDRVWFQGEALAVQTASGNVFLTTDFENWQPTRVKAPLSATGTTLRGEQELVEVDQDGVWRSLDGGRTWAGLNSTLPNLPAERIVGTRPLRIASRQTIFEWQRDGWARVADAAPAATRRWSEATDLLTTLEIRDGKLFRTVDGGG
ncbi:MAG: hypothetical protein NTV70_23645, partial [Acidobacteria bacterium]|nr:hypothetical protein [Acidobacteriota bacterium]